ncbi:nuclear transport factor 2 family protein [Streptomyces sp. WG7]|uniref:nuclear transport factor 2 family protein n=1 Tax=Streptomyces sp. WG7 TaxID=3417650 RepID=UPI003CE96634
MSLDKDVRLLMDRAAISDLLFTFARCLDEKDFEGYAALFAEDGILVLPRATHRGRAGLAAFVRQDLGRYHGTHHLSANHQITVRAEEAVSRSYLQAVHVPDGSDLTHWWSVGGWYDNTYRREGGDWRFTCVRVSPVWRGGTASPAPPPHAPLDPGEARPTEPGREP